MPSPDSCCLTAVQGNKDGQLSDELLIHHLFSHLPEPKVDIDDPIAQPLRLADLRIQDINPFCYFVRILVSDFVIQDPQPFENVFTVYRNGTAEEVGAAINAIISTDSVPHKILREEVRECVGQLALQDRRADVVKWCLEEDDGLRFEADFEIEANKVKEDEHPELYAVLDKYCFTNAAWNHRWRAAYLASQ